MARSDFNPENDFAPLADGNALSPDERIANAAEYSAYQLGQIKVQLRRIADALEQS